jgi:hypothetical protein
LSVAPTPPRAVVRTQIPVPSAKRAPSIAILGVAAVAIVLAGVLLWRFALSTLVAGEPAPRPAAAKLAPSVAVAPAAVAPAAVAPAAVQAAAEVPLAEPQPEPRAAEPVDVAAAKSASAPARSSSSRSKRAAAAAAAAVSATKSKLAPDWDEHLRAVPAGEAAPSAGRISDSDLR